MNLSAQSDNDRWDANFAPPILKIPEVLAIQKIGERLYFFRDGKFNYYDLKSRTEHPFTILGSGVIYAIAGHSDTIYVGGRFGGIGNIDERNLAMFDGESWKSVGGGVRGEVRAIAISERGNIYIGGGIKEAGGHEAENAAMYDGEEWHYLDGGLDDYVFDICVVGDRIYFVGGFNEAGGQASTGIACWNEATETWEYDIDTEKFTNNTLVNSIVSDGENIYIAGNFSMNELIGPQNVAKWNGEFWDHMNGGIAGYVSALAWDGEDLYVGGPFTAATGGEKLNHIGRWDGEIWKPLGDGVSGGDYASVFSIAVVGNDSIFAGGTFNQAGAARVNGIAYWRGGQWHDISKNDRNGVSSMVYAFAHGADDLLYVGGAFKQTGDVFSPGISSRDEDNWIGLDSGLVPPAIVYDLKPMNNEIYISGWCFGSFRQEFDNVAAWDVYLREWTELGNGIPAGDGDMGPMAITGGKVYYSGTFTQVDGVESGHIIAWNGSEWEGLAGGITSSIPNNFKPVRAMAALSDGRIVVGGYFDRAGGKNVGNIAIWNPASGEWSDMNAGVNDGVTAIYEYGNYIYIGGYFTKVGGLDALHVARYSKITGEWEALGEGISHYVYCMYPHAGAMYFGGSFIRAGGKDAISIARYDIESGEFFSLGDGIMLNDRAGSVLDLIVYKNDLYAGGLFTTAGGKPSMNIARWNDLETGVADYLGNNYSMRIWPNPFTGAATMEFFAPRTDIYSIELYNSLGEKVRTIANKEFPVGQNLISINANNLPPGLYICRIISNDFIINEKIILNQ
ncbi:MAG: T9SS type A sorting domain-containing protein [Candidatus Kapaibacterium sp.]